VEKYSIAWQATDDKVTHAHYKLDTQVDKHIFRICNPFRSSTRVMLVGKRLSLTLYLHCRFC